jgi:AsmA protein
MAVSYRFLGISRVGSLTIWTPALEGKLRLAFWSLAAIIAIGVGLVFVAPLFISAEDVRDRLFAEIEGATGYRLTVSGPLRISAFPSLKLVAEDVGVVQVADAGAFDLATAKELRFGLALAPLMEGRVHVTEIALIRPVIRMPDTGPKGQGAGSRGSNGASIANALQRLSLDKLCIEDGTVLLRGEGGAPGKRIEALTLEASLPSLQAPLSLKARTNFNGQLIQMAGSVANFGAFLEGTAARVLLDVDAPSTFPQKLALSGTATYTGNMFEFDGLTARAGDTALGGVLSADLSSDVPQIKASLNGDSLNLDALLGASAKGPAATADESAGWSDAKIDFSRLNTVNAQLNLSVEQLSYGTIKAGPISIRATMAGGKLKLELPNFQLYNGIGTGVLSVDATGKAPTQAFRFSLAKLDVYPFLSDAAGFDRIEGKGAIVIDLTTSGASQRALVSSLNGTASFEFTDGAIRGINVAKMVRNLASGALLGWQSGEAEKTDFASLGANFKIAKGKAVTSDLHLSGPLVRMAGAGTVDLPARTLNFRVDPQVVASLKGQGGAQDLQGLGVPVAINGPWAKPAIYPDIAGILEDPQAAYERLSKLSGGLVKLPSAGTLGDLGGTDGIAGLVKEKAGTSIEDLLQADRGTGQEGMVQGLGQLLGTDKLVAPATALAEPTAPPVEATGKKRGKKKQAVPSATQPVSDAPAQPVRPAPGQLMENLLDRF